MMLEMQKSNKPVNKAKTYRSVASKTGRSTKSVEYRMQNISYVLQLSGRTTVIGLAAARNVETNVLSQIEEILAESESRAPDSEIIFKAEVSKLQKRSQYKLPHGTKSPQRKDVTSTGYVRSPEVVAWILINANGKCESCHKEGPFITNNDDFFLEVHHVRFLSEGGSDTIENAVATCPNCHRSFHYSKDKMQLTEQLYKNVKRLVKATEENI
jgi:5-methylcytosine-specific restriction protein A